MNNEELSCHTCFAYAVPTLDWKRFANGTIHIEARCPQGHFLKWLPQEEPWISMLPPYGEVFNQNQKEGPAMSWDSFARDGQEGSGGDFDERPVIPEGMYRARVVRVGEPYDKANPQSGEMDTKFVVEFELSGGRLKNQTAVLPSFPKLTTKFLDTGYLSDKATVYKIMAALGYDMASFRFNPPEWVDLECEVLVKNTKNQDGSETSWITEYMKLPDDERTTPPEPARPAARQPVGAGAGRPSPRSNRDDWTE